MSDVLAAFLYAQLEVWPQIQAKRQSVWQRYDTELASWCEKHGVRRPVVPAHCEQAWHMYYLLLPSLEKRTSLIAHLKAQGVTAVFHYLPLHLSAFGTRFGGKVGDCPVTEDLSDRLLRLPFYNSYSNEEQSRVIEALASWGMA
jgi:dTDP-4-amino-4,6-dideoxygalactose transaminase